MKYLFLKLLLFISIKLFAPELPREMMISRSIELNNRNELYKMTIQNIMQAESFRSKPYLCPAVHKTIGYGHLLTKTDTLYHLNKKQALKQLKIDFDEMLKNTNPKLSYNKRLAIAHFSFNLGPDYYQKSLLKKRIDDGIPIDNLIVKYQYYRKNGKFVKSKHLLNARIFELKLYNL